MGQALACSGRLISPVQLSAVNCPCNAQTADGHGPEPRPAVELPIWRLNASLNRRWPAKLVSQSTVCRRYVQMVGHQSGFLP